jgi:hypothetical protein
VILILQSVDGTIVSRLGPIATSPVRRSEREAGAVDIVLVLVVVLVLAVVQIRRRGSRLQRAEELRRSEQLPPHDPPT